MCLTWLGLGLGLGVGFRVRDRVDHGHVVTDLFEGRLVADTAGEAELVPVWG